MKLRLEVNVNKDAIALARDLARSSDSNLMF